MVSLWGQVYPVALRLMILSSLNQQLVTSVTQKRGKQVTKWVNLWNGKPMEEVTWEDADKICNHFLLSALWMM